MNSSAFDGLEPAAMVTLVMLSAFAPDADVPVAAVLELELEHAATRTADGISSIARRIFLGRRRLIGLDFIEPLLGGVCRRPRWALGDPPWALRFSGQPRDMQSTVDRSKWSRLRRTVHNGRYCVILNGSFGYLAPITS